MRTTIKLDNDTAEVVRELRREHDLGLSQAVNELIRRGMLSRPRTHQFEPRTRSLGIRVDVSNVPDALDDLEDAARG